MSCGVREEITSGLLLKAIAELGQHELIFSIQKHDAKSMHWDLRLQHGSVMPSWAVPKGLPECPEDGNRLGIKVEDHDLDYATFNGHIPEGQYGAGQVELVDCGAMEVLRWDDIYIKVRLHGLRFSGVWSLRNTKGKNWLVKCTEGGD
jgi:bifunctional non-homologous end joining protein LigD